MTGRRPKPLASISLDLDNQWSYMKTHGDAGWQAFPSYLDICVPRFLEMFEALGLKMTVFVVGQDAALSANRGALASIPAAGHEVGNHSFHHEPWLHLYSDSDVAAELAEAEAAIEAATGVKPTGFRGPGFSVSPAVLETLAARGYRYDASTFPTFLGPLARAYYFFNAQLTPAERERRKLLFGSLAEGLRPLKPYRWQLADRALLEIPVTTMPGTRAPFHLSYLLFLAARSPALALAYFKTALALCRATGVEPSLLLHPLDFLSGEDCNALAFFPAMAMPAKDKLAFTRAALTLFRDRFDVLPMGEHAARIEARGTLPIVVPKRAAHSGSVPLPVAQRGIAP